MAKRASELLLQCMCDTEEVEYTDERRERLKDEWEVVQYG